MVSASPTIATLAKTHEINRKRAPRSIADLPVVTPIRQAPLAGKGLKEGIKLALAFFP
jgi:hypothetical protein